MVELTLTALQQDLQQVTRSFATGEIGPAVAAADRSGGHLEPEEYLRLFRSAAAIGLPAMLIPERYGGTGLTTFDNAVVQEELGAVDVGLAGSLNLTMTLPAMIVAGGSHQQCEAWLSELVSSDELVLAGALNEPSVAGSELFCPIPDPDLGIRTTATYDGSEWLIDGAKAGWVTNAGVAQRYLVFARTSFAEPAIASTTAFYLEADRLGLTTGPRSALLGMRSGFHAEVLLDGVRVPDDRRLGDEGGGLRLMGESSAGMAVGLAAGFVGLARTALADLLDHADTRRSWGQPLRSHQAVALQIADAAVDLQTARLLVWDAALAVDHGDPAASWKVPAAKTHAVDVAIANAERSVRIHGATGVSSGAGPEKLLRDAWTGYACDFTKEMLRLSIAEVL